MRLVLNKKFFSLFAIIVIIVYCLVPSYKPHSATNNKKFHLLVINSYNSSSEWESFVIDGVKRKLDSNNDIELSYEYLDIRTRSDDSYLKSFSNLLNLKYSTDSIDAVLTIDDEAFDFARTNLFNSTSILFEKPIVFTGVNEHITLTNYERNFITGVLGIEDNIAMINMILNIHKEVDELNIILDNAKYSQVIKSNLLSTQKFFCRPIKLNFIQSEFIDDISKELSLNSNPNQANIIIGDFNHQKLNMILSANDTIQKIENSSPNPIYTKSQPYLAAGSVGGTIDWGQNYGYAVGSILLRLSYGENVKNILPIYDSLEQNVFNYNVIRKYNINPSLLPKNSIFINKGPLDFLLPTHLLIIVWGLLFLSIMTLIILIYRIIKHKKNSTKNKLLYLEAQKAEKIKTEFISNVSHELRTPLNIILSTCKLLSLKIESNTLDDTYLSDKIYSIVQSSNRLLRLVNNILDVTKIESGFITAHFKMENIVAIIEDTVLSVVDFAKTYNIDIIFDTEEEEIITSVDSIKLERVILNLLSNSIKFTNCNGIIEVFVKSQNNNIIITVKDNGIGIPQQYINLIFERFKQVDTSFTRINEGSGLGLFIAKGIVELHNGSITVDSIEGVGSTFTISLPISIIDNDSDKYVIDGYDLNQLATLELSDIDHK